MAKKNQTLKSLLEDTITKINSNSNNAVSVNNIPNIIEFCESPKYLNLRGKGVELYPVQKLILRSFYRGSIGNTSKECMEMTDEEIEICKRLKLDNDLNGNIIKKWQNYNPKQDTVELVLVLGRRSGKDFIGSIIALYEVMKLIESPSGDPYREYNLDSSTPIVLLTIATSADQATTAYREIYGKVMTSPYFKDKIVKEGIGVTQINFLTYKDKESNKKAREEGMPVTSGSIQVETGHSNSNSLVGKTCFMIIFDEMAKYRQTNSAQAGEQLWTNLTPTVRTYSKELPNNEKQYFGKIICISTPEGEDGIFYELYKNSADVEHRLMFKLPTWEVNLRHTKDSLRKIERDMTDEKFMREYGAEFSGLVGQNFFTKEIIDECFETHNFQFREHGEPGYSYFVHLDPAIKTDNYALVVVHKHYFYNTTTNKLDYWIILDHVKTWVPTKNKPVNIEEVDNYVIDLNKHFNIGVVTYDQMFSHHSIEKLKKYGIPAKKFTYNQRNKMMIYNEFLQLASNSKVKLPHLKLLKDEMVHLQKKPLGNGFRIYAKRDGDVTTDDIIDALCGAVFQCNHAEIDKLPKSRLVYMGGGNSPGANTTWRSMSGMVSHGTGQQIAKFLENKGIR